MDQFGSNDQPAPPAGAPLPPPTLGGTPVPPAPHSPASPGTPAPTPQPLAAPPLTAPTNAEQAVPPSRLESGDGRTYLPTTPAEPPKKRRTAVLVAAGVALVALVGGGVAIAATRGGDSASAVSVSGSGKKTQEAKTARVEIEVSGKAAGRTITFTGDGAIDFAHNQSSMSIDLGKSLGGALPGGFTMKTVSDNGTGYLNFGSLGQMLGIDEGKWVKVDQAQLKKIGAGGTGITDGANAGDLVGLANGIIDDKAEKVGTDTLSDGTKATHFRATLSLQEFLKKAGKDTKAAQEAFDKLGIKDEQQVDVWVDSAGRLRQVQIAIAATGAVKLTMTTRYLDLGKPVSITVPPKSDVIDFSDVPLLAGGLGG